MLLLGIAPGARAGLAPLLRTDRMYTSLVPEREQGMGARWCTFPQQQRQVAGCINIQGNARKFHDRRFDPASFCGGEVRQKAVLAKLQWHRACWRAEYGVRAAFVPRRHDGETPRVVLRRLAVNKQQVAGVLGLHERNVGRQGEHVVARSVEPGRCRCYRRGMSVCCCFLQHSGAVTVCDGGDSAIGRGDKDGGETGGLSQSDQHVLEHRLHEQLPLLTGENLREPLLGAARFFNRHYCTNLAGTLHVDRCQPAAFATLSACASTVRARASRSSRLSMRVFVGTTGILSSMLSLASAWSRT